MLAKNKSGWTLMEYLDISENEIENYKNVTGVFAIVKVKDQYLIGFNAWRKQWEFPAGGIEKGETAREAAKRELFEETHQNCLELKFRGLFKVQKPDGSICYQAVFQGCQEKLQSFAKTEEDEMEKIRLWDLTEDIGYVDECDLMIVKMVCR